MGSSGVKLKIIIILNNNIKDEQLKSKYQKTRIQNIKAVVGWNLQSSWATLNWHKILTEQAITAMSRETMT